MRVKKFKKFQRHLNFYMKNFHLKSPYQIIVDGTFAKAALDNRVSMREQLPKYLDAQVKLLTTPCVLLETESLGPQLYGALQVLKQLTLYKCGHGDKALPPPTCIQQIVRGASEPTPSSSKTQASSSHQGSEVNNKYFIATQDSSLSQNLRQIPGIPLIHLYRSAPALEKPSEASTAFAQQMELKKMEVLNYQQEILDQMKKEELGETKVPERKGTKKRKRVGPNPLSCKKSKKVKGEGGRASQPPPTTPPPPKKRKRIRLPKHVKAELANSKPSSN